MNDIFGRPRKFGIQSIYTNSILSQRQKFDSQEYSEMSANERMMQNVVGSQTSNKGLLLSDEDKYD